MFTRKGGMNELTLQFSTFLGFHWWTSASRVVSTSLEVKSIVGLAWDAELFQCIDERVIKLNL